MDEARDADAPGRPAARRGGVVAVGSAVVALAVLVLLAFHHTVEVNRRRDLGFCRADPGIPGAVGSEERTWWPVGDRCFLRLPDGTTQVREPRWTFTALLAAWAAVVAAGAVAGRRSAWRTLAWSVVVPAVPTALVVLAVVQPHSPARLVAITSISLAFGSFMGAVTAAAVWYVLRGRVLPTVLGSWFAWSVVVLLQGRDSIGP